jgi:hypothetical protein
MGGWWRGVAGRRDTREEERSRGEEERPSKAVCMKVTCPEMRKRMRAESTCEGCKREAQRVGRSLGPSESCLVPMNVLLVDCAVLN